MSYALISTNDLKIAFRSFEDTLEGFLFDESKSHLIAGVEAEMNEIRDALQARGIYRI